MKQITIGITGHRDVVQTEQLEDELREFFLKILNKEQKVKLLSPLADGADRLVADIYLEVFKS